MKIEITGNTEPKSWYRDRIGQQFEVLETNEDKKHYIVHKGRLLDSFVEFQDCKIIEENSTEISDSELSSHETNEHLEQT